MSDFSNDRIDFAAANSAACDAVLRLRGEPLANELGRIARALRGTPSATTSWRGAPNTRMPTAATSRAWRR
jgi:hypothetical protein